MHGPSSTLRISWEHVTPYITDYTDLPPPPGPAPLASAPCHSPRVGFTIRRLLGNEPNSTRTFSVITIEAYEGWDQYGFRDKFDLQALTAPYPFATRAPTSLRLNETFPWPQERPMLVSMYFATR